MALHNPQEDALMALLAPKRPKKLYDDEYSMDVNAPVELARLRHERQRELENRVAMGTDTRADPLLKMLTREQDEDPYTGVAEQKRISDIQQGLDEAASYQRPEIAEHRRGREAYELAKVGEPARVTGRYGLERERIQQAGELEQQQAASAGLMGAAMARGGGAGGGNRLASGLVERVAGGQTALDILDRLERNFKSEYVGPARGRLNLLAQVIPGIPVGAGFAGFSADSATLANATIKAITGAQMSEPEAVRIMRQIPTEKDKDVVWHAKKESMRANLAEQMSNIRDVNAAPVSAERLMELASEMGIRLR